MNLRIFPVLLLCSVFLCSCVQWVAVRTHSYPDSVGKMVYVPYTEAEKVNIYEHNGVQYAQLPYYKVPASPALLRYSYAFKSTYITDIPAADIPAYTPDTPLYYLYMAVGARHENTPFLLSGEHFAGLTPVGTRRSIELGAPAGGFSPERSRANYLMMPLTLPLLVADTGLSGAATLGAYVFYNIPVAFSVLLSAF